MEETSAFLAAHAPAENVVQPLQIWQQYQLYKEPLVAVKCVYLKDLKQCNGQLIMGRSHIIFQSDDETVFIARRYFSITSIQFAPTLKITGGCSNEGNYTFSYQENKLIKKEISEMFHSQVETLVMQSIRAQSLLNNNPNIDFSPTVEFLNFPFQMQVILLDLYNLATGRMPPSLVAKQPSYAAIWPNIFDETYQRYEAHRGIWLKIQVVLQGNKMYFFNTRGSSHPICVVRLTEIECEQKFINELCEQVPVQLLVQILKKRQRKVVGMSLDGNTSKQSYTKYDQGLTDFINRSEINPITTLANIIKYGNLRQVLAIDFGNDLEDDMETLIQSQYEVKETKNKTFSKVDSSTVSVAAGPDKQHLDDVSAVVDNSHDRSKLLQEAKEVIEEEPTSSSEDSVYDNNFYVAAESITKLVYLRDMIQYAQQLAEEMIIYVVRKEMGHSATRGSLIFEYTAKFSGDEKGLNKGDFRLYKLVLKDSDQTRLIGSYIEFCSGKTTIAVKGSEIASASLETVKKMTQITNNVTVNLRDGRKIISGLSSCDLRDARSIVEFINKQIWESNI